MRMIKFRGKSLIGEWVYGWLVIQPDGTTYISQYFKRGEWIQINPKTVGQYADVPNRDDTEFCEGDIIRVPDYNPDYHIQQIVFKDGAFCGYNDKKHCKWTYLDVIVRANQTAEVIGNIHDNPELMEGLRGR